MLGKANAMATIAVKDIDVARKFYEGTLGLKASGTEVPEVVAYASGSSNVMIYRSQFAGTNKATAATWVVGAGLEKIVEGLKAKGVTFEHYDMPGMARKGDIHGEGNMKAAWLKDPDGNILALVTGG